MAGQGNTSLPEQPVSTLVTFEEFAGHQHDHPSPGRLHDLEFPSTADQIRTLGAPWLTRAFHAAGTLAFDNSVARIVSITEFVDGGAGKKCKLQVEYAREDEDLHRELFVKLPHGPEMLFDKYLCAIVFNQYVPEVVFGARLSQRIPVSTPRCYFADYDAASVDFITIHADVSPPVRVVEGATYRSVPRFPKCMDYRHPNITPYYDVILQQLATMCGWSKRQPLHEIFSEHPTFRYTDDPAHDPDFSTLCQFVVDVGRAVMPDELLAPEFLSTLEGQLKHVASQAGALAARLASKPDYVAFGHVNLNIDNGLFFENEAGAIRCEVVDWGGYSAQPIASLLVGCLSCTEAELFERNVDRWLESFITQYARAGGPSLDYEELSLQLDLALALGTTYAPMVMPLIYQNLPQADWARIKGRTDPVLEDNFLARCWSRTVIAGLQRYKQRNAYNAFRTWLDAEAPAKTG